MGRPKGKETLEALEGRGSPEASRRRQEENRAKVADIRERFADRRRTFPVIRPTQKCFDLIPGYDPQATADGAKFYAARARAAVSWFHENLQHLEGEWRGTAFRLEPWQQAIVMNLYGWLQPDGTRRYREALIYIPRKNGKTILCAGLALHAFFCDDEPGAQIIAAAAERGQAEILRTVATHQVARESVLLEQTEVKNYAMWLKADPLTRFKAVSAEAGTKHGMNPHIVTLDELHAQKDRNLVEALRTGMGSRRQPLFLFLTTADYQRESICNEVYEHACKVRDGVIPDPSFLPVIYEAQPDDDWTDEEVWKKANPNYGVSVKPSFLKSECAKAQSRPSEVDSFRRLYLNIRTNAELAAIDIRQWDKGGQETYAELKESLRGRRAFGGLDLSRRIDLTAFDLWFPDDNAVLSWFWIPRAGAVQAQERDRVPYLVWAKDDYLTLIDGDVIDYNDVEVGILEACKGFDVINAAFDPKFATEIVQRLSDKGLEMVEFNQTAANYNAPCKELEAYIADGKIRHGGQPVLRWNAANLMWKRDANDYIRPDKIKSTGRIDGMVALLMAIGQSLEAEEKAPYQEEVLVI
jgi:phage terminase large subunit-like protein